MQGACLPVTRAPRPIVATIAAAAVCLQLAPIAAAQHTLADAHASFYTARYEETAAMTTAPCAAGDIEACELRTSALLFDLKRALDDAKDKDRAFKECARCPALLEAFLRDTAHGQRLAREALAADAADDDALFFLGKMDLNYVWLHAGTLGRKTGWDQYWEARRSLDLVLKRNPDHIRAKVARAWIDYIVDTRIPWAMRWVLGGGSRKKALVSLREAAAADADRFTAAEARFGLWDMLVREKNISEAVVVARELSRDFPENADLPKFLAAHDPYFQK
jgi:hypothetical protein